MTSKFMRPCHFCDTEKTKKGTGTAKSAKGRDAPIPPSISFCIDSLAQHIDGSRRITNIYLSSLPSSLASLLSLFARGNRKMAVAIESAARIAVSKQLRIRSFWKESAGDFLNFSRSEEISAWKLLKWLLCLISIPISTSASLPFPFFLSSLVIFLSLHYLFIFGKDWDLGRQKFSHELLDKD